MNVKHIKQSNTDYSDTYNQFLSFVDLERDPEWNDAWKSQDESKVEQLLHKYGADLKYGWEVEVILHRPRTSNAAEYGPKINFVERTDAEFAPYVATEDMIANTKDSFLKAELMVMSKRSNFSGDLIDKYGEEGEEA